MLILSKDRPDISLYYLGSSLIRFMKGSNISEIHLSSLYQDFNEHKSISFNRFMLVLDWLFMIGLITGSTEGKIVYVPKRTNG